MRKYFKTIFCCGLLMAIPSVSASFSGGYIKAGFSFLGLSYLKYNQPSTNTDDKETAPQYTGGWNFSLFSAALGYGKLINDSQVYLGVELNGRQDLTRSGLFVAKANVLGRLGWECKPYMLPYIAAGVGVTNIQGSKGKHYEAYPHLVGVIGIDFKILSWLRLSPVLEAHMSVNDFQNVKYQVGGKVKVEFQYSF